MTCKSTRSKRVCVANNANGKYIPDFPLPFPDPKDGEDGEYLAVKTKVQFLVENCANVNEARNGFLVLISAVERSWIPHLGVRPCPLTPTTSRTA